MVEIKQEMVDAPPPQAEDGAKYRLIYAKSKVYVNPTAYARDNIPGFAAIVKRVRDPFFGSEMHYLTRRYPGGVQFDISVRLDPRNPPNGERTRRVGQVPQD